MAITAGVVTLTVFPLGLLFGIIALARPNAKRERGHGLAVASVTVTSSILLILAVAFPAGLLEPLWKDYSDSRTEVTLDPGTDEAPGTDGAPGDSGGATEDDGTPPGQEQVPGGGQNTDDTTSLFGLLPGDCFNSSLGPGEYGDTDGTATVIPCDEPHDGELVALADVTGVDGPSYAPGTEALVWDSCLAHMRGYLVDIWEVPYDVGLIYYLPADAVWEAGDHTVLCVLESLTGSQLDAPLRRDEADFTAEQLAYLDATGPLDIALWDEPLPEDDIELHRTWAAEVAGLLTEQAAALEAGDWSPGVAAYTGELADARRAGVAGWEAAAGATDRDALDTAVEAAYTTLYVDSEFGVRQELGLAWE
ncbi:DUF4190 domain-containing protein [Streptomyces sp. RFCAC02]|uniref:DUF4190 domain-containing protein n=1 Tax=Streptomyces sp. RFCAC02 TaxID=2499143 RepID=UPI001021578F|nr:DUF4190 domain-containing protein [Streptomyces sp. RFCAC02]